MHRKMDAKDRRAELLKSTAALNGIDFVEIASKQQTTLRVHFLNDVQLRGTLSAAPVIDGGEKIRTVAVLPINDATAWSVDDTHLVLTLQVLAPGDFSNYTLHLQSPFLDPFFATVQFSFKALCPSDLDCEPAPIQCPPVTANIPPIDYLAKDFLSFRQALLDFSALRYPQWQERSEADFGMMFLEALAASADDLSYTQDRIAAEATLATATQRRSVVRHARLVDYEPTPATAACVLLQFEVARGVTSIRDGQGVLASVPDGTPIVFETGTSLVNRLIDPTTGVLRPAAPSTPADSAWNRGIQPYWFDDSQRCLQAGATAMYVLGRGYNFQPGQALLIETQAATTADPPIRQIVHLLQDSSCAVELCDPVFTRRVEPDNTSPPFWTCLTSPPTPPGGQAPTAVTQIQWQSQDALATARDLTQTVLAGNLVPATQGATVAGEQFVIGVASPPPAARPGTVVRTGARPTQEDGTPGTPPAIHLYTLAKAPVVWLPAAASNGQATDGDGPLPEIVVQRIGETVPWDWFRRLLDAGQFNLAYTLDAARYSQIARNSDGSIQYEYDGDAGDTIRFGDGVFGEAPNDGDQFMVTYRVGGGAISNVAADSITQISEPADPGLLMVTNPLPAGGGTDAESLDSIRRLAPQAFRAQQFRAVIPADYQAAAQTLPWVQQAGTVFRWTGSWLTVFTAADPRGSEQMTVAQRLTLVSLLNRYRMAGYESYTLDPEYLSLDILIQVCAVADAFQSDVETGLLNALNASNPNGFFNHSNFNFGQPLERSALEAAVQAVPGVAGLLCVRYRVRGGFALYLDMNDTVAAGTGQIIRCDNDPSLPEHGSLSVNVQGGK
jgi:predicted phage baseplate assembly protein